MPALATSTLATSGDLGSAQLLHNRLFTCQILDDDKWKEYGTLALFENTAFLNDEKLYNVNYHELTASVRYSFGKGDDHRAGALTFTDDHLAFVGTMLRDTGESVAVRGNLDTTVFDTQRKLKSDTTGSYTAWLTFTLGTEWVEETFGKQLEAVFKLGDQDISGRTAVSRVVKWQTTIEMVKSDDLMNPGKDTFEIVVDPLGEQFSGTYTDGDGVVYEWKGVAQGASLSNSRALTDNFVSNDGPAVERLVNTMDFTANLRGEAKTGPDLSVQDLLTISSLVKVKENDREVVRDNAQLKTGQYLQAIMVDSLEDKWIKDFFGDKVILTKNVEAIKAKHTDFYKKTAVMNLGQMIHDKFGEDERHKLIVKRIDNDKLKDAWKALGTDKDYGSQSSELYVEGYRDGVPGIQPYLENDPKGWAKKLFDVLTSDGFIQTWKVQASSKQFSAIQTQLYEWWVQLTVLDPDPVLNYPDRMLHTLFAAAVSTKFNKVTWQKELEPYLAKAIDNVVKGDPELAKKMGLTEEFGHTQNQLQRMIATFRSQEEFVGYFLVFLTSWASLSQNKTKPAVEILTELQSVIGDDYVNLELFEEQVPTFWDRVKSFATGGKEWWGEWGSVFLNVGKALLYAAGAGFLIYQIVSGARAGTLNPIEGIGLGVLSIGLLVKTIQALLATGIGEWLLTALRDYETTSPGSGISALRSVVQWFTEGIDEESVAARIFGKDAAASFAKRFGPIVAVLALGLAAWTLATAITSGWVPDIVFSAINVAVAFAQSVFAMFEIASVWWAGPLGLVVAAVGLLVLAIQWIVNTFHPKPLPPDPVEEFVNGPLKDAGYVTASA